MKMRKCGKPIRYGERQQEGEIGPQMTQKKFHQAPNGDFGFFPESFLPSSSSLFFCSLALLLISTPIFIIAPNNDAVPVSLHSRYLVTSFDRPLTRTVGSPQRPNTLHSSALIPWWV